MERGVGCSLMSTICEQSGAGRNGCLLHKVRSATKRFNRRKRGAAFLYEVRLAIGFGGEVLHEMRRTGFRRS